MRTKRLVVVGLSFAAGVVIGFLGFPFLIWGCMSGRGQLSAMASTNQTAAGITLELGTNVHRGITIRRKSQQVVISAPPHVLWVKMAVARQANAAFVLALDDLGQGLANPRSLIRLSLPNDAESISNYVETEILGHAALSNLVGEAFIQDLAGVSDDGKRLLLRLSLQTETEATWPMSFNWPPTRIYYYYPAENKLDEIRP